MPNAYFQFKQFTIWQDQCAMKVGTDGVLLGAWTRIENAKRILDIGTGTGLIAIMLAQRSEALIDAVEIEVNACRQAKNNIEACPWKDRITVFNTSFQDFYPAVTHYYDLIVSNPPFFKNSLKAPDKERTSARHDDTLSFSDLIKGAFKLLKDTGKLTVIIPCEQAEEKIYHAEENRLFCHRLTQVYPRSGIAPVRCLIEFQKNRMTRREETLVIEKTRRHEYTGEYIALTRDFYLAF